MQRRSFIRQNLALVVSGASLAAPLAGLRTRSQASAAEPVKIATPQGRPLRIGMIELDTSHSDTLGRVIAEVQGARITAVINRGLVYGKERTEKFVRDYNIKHVCSSLDQMVPLVDVALVVGCNWENHVADAEPFIAAGKPVFIDKPCVGTEADARHLLELQLKHKTPVFGGSTVRYADNLQEFKKNYQSRSDKVALTVYGKINSHSRDHMHDLIYYGIHGVEAMQEVVGTGAVKVNYLDFYRKEHLIHVGYEDRPPVVLMLGPALKGPQLSLLTDTAVEHLTPSAENGYTKLLSAIAKSLATGRADRPISEQIEACRILIAAKKSRTLGRPVYLDELEEGDGFDGKAFGLEYSRFRNLNR
ncbi:Gfo/Idh/MocA family oxidoreductase [Gemmatimonadota bacterium]